MRIKHIGYGAVIAATLAACSSQTAPVANLAAYDGVYAGTGRSRTTNPACNAGGNYFIELRQGQATGSVRRADGQGNPVGFQAYLEYDATMFAQVNFGGDSIEIRGRFSPGRFTGEAKANAACVQDLSLAKRS
jgi:hypothetical protein